MAKAAAKSGLGSTPMKGPKRDIPAVWTEYKKTKSEALRNILMENYLHLLRYNAERIHVKLPDEVELTDPISAAFSAFIAPINPSTRQRRVQSETSSAPRIPGPSLHEIPSM